MLRVALESILPFDDLAVLPSMFKTACRMDPPGLGSYISIELNIIVTACLCGLLRSISIACSLVVDPLRTPSSSESACFQLLSACHFSDASQRPEQILSTCLHRSATPHPVLPQRHLVSTAEETTILIDIVAMQSELIHWKAKSA